MRHVVGKLALLLFITLFAKGSAIGAAARYHHSVTLLPNGNVLIVGGQTAAGAFLNTAQIFISSDGTTTGAPDMDVARASHTATLLPNGLVLVAGGASAEGTASYLSSARLFNYITGQWSNAAALGTARSGHTATLLQDGTVLIAGGQNTAGAYLSVTEIYNPTGDSWSAAQGMNQGRSNHTATLLYNGEVLMAGGFSTGTFLASAEIYNTNTGFRIAQPLNVGRAFHNAVALADRTVLLTGGYNYAYTTAFSIGYLDSVELFDPVQETWTLKSSMKERRRQHTTTLLPDGRVSVLGGMGNIPRQILDGEADTTSGSVAYTGACVAGEESLTITPGSSVITLNDFKMTYPLSYNGLVLEGLLILNGEIQHTTGTIKINYATATIKNSEITDGVLNISVLNIGGIIGTIQPVECPLGANPITNDFGEITFTITGATVTVSTMVFADNELYTKSGDSWSFGVRMSTQRVSQASVLMPSGEQFVVNGSDGIDANPIGRTTYIPVGGSWSGAASMSQSRSYFTSTLLSNGRVLAAGGSSANNIGQVFSTAETYDPDTNQWSQTGSMTVPRTHHTLTLLPNGRVLATGGFSTINGTTEAVSSAEIYYPDTGLWRPSGSMSEARNNHTATLLANGNVLVTGGYRNGVYLNTAEIYISTSGLWVSLSNMPSGRALHTATLLPDGRVFLTGGFNGNALNTTVFFNGSNFTAGPALNGARHSHAATLLDGGQVLVSGGNDGNGELTTNTWEMYSPLSNSWTAAPASGQMVGRYSHTATLLPTGHVLVTGGLKSTGYLNNVEYFHPEFSSWTALGSLSSARAYHNAVLLPDGKILAVGGYSGSADLTSAELSYHNSYIPEESRRPAFTTVSSTITIARAATLAATGSYFTSSNIEANSGLGSQNSSSLQPRPQLQNTAFSFGVDLTTYVFTTPNTWTLAATSVSFQVPSSTGFPYGWYHLRMNSDAAVSKSKMIQIAPSVPTQAPSSLAGVSVGSSTVNWSWTAPSGTFDAYNVYSATSGAWITTTTATSFVHTGLAPNTPVSIKVAAYTLGGDGPVATSSSVYTLANPPATLAVGTVTFNSAHITWSSNGNLPETVYEISMSTDNFTLDFSSPAAFSDSYRGSTFTVSGLSGNTTYYFRVRTQNGANVLTAFTNIVSTQTPLSSPIQGLTAANATANTITWSWTSVSGILSYKVYQSTSGLLIGNPTANSFTQTGLSTNTAYGVTVSAVSPLGEGPVSNAASSYTAAADPIVVSFTPTETSFTSRWLTNTNPYPTTYYVELSTDSLFQTVTASSYTLAMGSAVITGLTPNTLYYGRMLAINAAGTRTNFQSFGSAYTLANIPAHLRITGLSASKVTLTWSANSNPAETPFQLLASTDSFNLTASTPVAFSASFTGTTVTVSSLFTSTTYQFRVMARNSAGIITGFASTQTLTSNGFAGAPTGSLALELGAGSAGSAEATLTSGRSVAVTVPAGSFSEDLVLTVSEATSFNCGPITGGINVLTSVAAQPLVPVTLTVSYSLAEITGDPKTLVLSRYDTASGKCVPLPSTVDTTARTITARTNHFSTFQIAQEAPSSSIGTVRVYPNPFYPSRGNGYVTLDRLPAGTRIRIFTIHGELVTEGHANESGIYSWPGLNSSGQVVASGIYLTMIESGGTEKIIKIAVER